MFLQNVVFCVNFFQIRKSTSEALNSNLSNPLLSLLVSREKFWNSIFYQEETFSFWSLHNKVESTCGEQICTDLELSFSESAKIRIWTKKGVQYKCEGLCLSCYLSKEPEKKIFFMINLLLSV